MKEKPVEYINGGFYVLSNKIFKYLKDDKSIFEKECLTKLSKKKILLLSSIIKENALAFSIGIATVKEIDKINILNASILAMHRAINTLTIKAELLLIDGNHFKKHSIPHQCIIKGDSKLMSIAAASILAKNYRDELMKKLNIEHPEYNWLNNKGYPTNEHRKNIQNFGITKHHRKSFQLLESQLVLKI